MSGKPLQMKLWAKDIKLEYLEKTGLTIVKDESRFDRFKGRVMFPIHSMSGRVLGIWWSYTR